MVHILATEWKISCGRLRRGALPLRWKEADGLELYFRDRVVRVG